MKTVLLLAFLVGIAAALDCTLDTCEGPTILIFSGAQDCSGTPTRYYQLLNNVSKLGECDRSDVLRCEQNAYSVSAYEDSTCTAASLARVESTATGMCFNSTDYEAPVMFLCSVNNTRTSTSLNKADTSKNIWNVGRPVQCDGVESNCTDAFLTQTKYETDTCDAANATSRIGFLPTQNVSLGGCFYDPEMLANVKPECITGNIATYFYQSGDCSGSPYFTQLTSTDCIAESHATKRHHTSYKYTCGTPEVPQETVPTVVTPSSATHLAASLFFVFVAVFVVLM